MSKPDKNDKKHDLRDEIPATMSVTNTESRMAGGLDNPNVKVGSGNQTLKPGVVDSTVPDGQDTKSS
jgi:hypothetical protein